MKRSLIYSGLLVACLLLVAIGPVRADTLDTFTYTSGGATFVWQLPASPTPLYFNTGDDHFTVELDTFTLDGIDLTESSILDFFGSGNLGGFEFTATPFLLAQTTGDPLFTGALGTPTFAPGTYSLTDFAFSDSGVPGTLVITSPAAVPEPSGLLLFACGMLGLIVFTTLRKVIA